jgi:hypothetical protein
MHNNVLDRINMSLGASSSLDEKKAMREMKEELRKSGAGAAIADNNLTRIVDFCRAYYVPLFAWVLYKDFGYRYVRLVRFGQQFNKIIGLVAETNEADKLRLQGVVLPESGGKYPHHYLSLHDIKSDLQVECGYSYLWQKKNIAPTKASIEEYARHHARNHAMRTMDNMRLIWLHTMWTTFGFGKKRLKLCEEYFREHITNLPFSTFKNMLEEMEKVCQTKTDAVSFATNRRIFKKLGVDKEGAAALLQGRMRKVSGKIT